MKKPFKKSLRKFKKLGTPQKLLVVGGIIGVIGIGYILYRRMKR